MTSTQRKTILVLSLLGLLYFLLFIPPNLTGARDIYMISLFRPDEFAQYSHPIRMLSGGKSLSEGIYRFIAYQHYYYGFPFYLLSALTLLPIKLTAGLGGAQWNMLALRQVVSVLPMTLAAGLLVFMLTRFKKFWLSILAFLFLLTIPAVVENNLWWHPESLVILWIVLVFFFLDRDDLRFGPDFYLAAVAAGLATSTKLLGLFFFLTIPVYLLIGWRQGKFSWKRLFSLALLFVGVMLLVFLVTSPHLLIPSQLQAAFAIQLKQQKAMSSGWTVAYARGILSWLPIITRLYGSLPFIVLSLFALTLGAWKGVPPWGTAGAQSSATPGLRALRVQRLALLVAVFVIPFALYILLAIAIKPRHFFLPHALLLFSSLLYLYPFMAEIVKERPWRKAEGSGRRRGVFALAGLVLVIGLFGWQFYTNFTRSVEIYVETLNRERDSAEIAFWRSLEQEQLDLLPVDQTFKIFRDVKMYVPDSPRWEVQSRWGLTDYDLIERFQPELIVLWRQRINDYTQEGILEEALNPNQLQQAYNFYADAEKGGVAGYRLIYQNETGLAFLRDELYQRWLAR